jgi:hypothetical protein
MLNRVMWWRVRENRRLLELEEHVEKLERGYKQLTLEWEDFYEKARRQVWRINQRAAAIEKSESEAAPDLPEEREAPNLGFLTPRQRQLQQSIIARRRAPGRAGE